MRPAALDGWRMWSAGLVAGVLLGAGTAAVAVIAVERRAPWLGLALVGAGGCLAGLLLLLGQWRSTAPEAVGAGSIAPAAEPPARVSPPPAVRAEPDALRPAARREDQGPRGSAPRGAASSGPVEPPTEAVIYASPEDRERWPWPTDERGPGSPPAAPAPTAEGTASPLSARVAERLVDAWTACLHEGEGHIDVTSLRRQIAGSGEAGELARAWDGAPDRELFTFGRPGAEEVFLLPYPGTMLRAVADWFYSPSAGSSRIARIQRLVSPAVVRRTRDGWDVVSKGIVE